MLIGMIGQAQNGKDTVADELVKNYNFTKKSLAQPLKEACKHIFQLTDRQVNGDLKEIPDPRWNGVKPRKLLQIVGTELIRNILIKYIPELKDMDNTIWIHNFNLWYENNKDKNVVIADIRFQDEAKMIKDHGGILIRINRGEPNLLDLHQSEQELLNIEVDYIIENNSTLDDLYMTIKTIINNE